MNKRLFIIIGLLFLWTCEEAEFIQDNSLDESNPDYVTPIVAFTSGPTAGQTIDASGVTFNWEGNELITEYRTKRNDEAWNDWSGATTLVWQYLDEGDHQITLQGRYDSGDTSDVVSVSFIVDAVRGPALIFHPRAVTTAVGSSVTFQVMAEEVTNLTAAQFNIGFDPSKLQILAVTQGPMLQISGESILNADYDNTAGSVSIITAALGGSQPSVDGTGVLMELELKINAAGTSILEFDGTELFRDPNNNDITIA
ncbi:MAG: hypothetical protein HON82_04540, partial [Candidatus Marinimicrobia bacterium]|nr:hypothetical protein [Candidatus Neomarinimicrobiota bacterium]